MNSLEPELVAGCFFVMSSEGEQEEISDDDIHPADGRDRIVCWTFSEANAEAEAARLAKKNPGVRYYVQTSISGFLGSVDVTKEAF